MILIKKQVAAKLLVGVAVVGVAFSPVMASAATDTTTVEATVASVISVDSAATVAMSVTPTSTGAEATATDSVTVHSNDADGYNLTLKNADTTLTMAGSQGGTLAKTAGTYGIPAALSTNSWGYSLSGFAAGTYAGVESTEQNIATTTAVSAETTGDIVNVTYGVKVNTAVPAGVYTDSVVYTATVK